MKGITNKRKKEYIYIGITFVIALILACYYLKVWYFPWNKPETSMDFNRGDLLFETMLFKNMITDGNLWQGIHLGAPFKYTLYDFPVVADALVNTPIFLIGKIFGNAVIGMFIVLILTFPITAVASYYAIKQFKVQSTIAVIGAIAYSFIPFKMIRMWPHYGLANTLMVIPISVVLLYWLYNEEEFLVIRKDMFKYKKNILALIFIIMIGIGEVYYAYFFCFFVLIVTVMNLLENKAKLLTIKKGLIVILGAIFVVVINLLPCFINTIKGLDTLEKPIRNAFETELYGLKLTHLLMPYNTGIEIFDSLKNEYNTTTLNNNSTAFLGIYGCIGFIILLIALFSNHVFAKRENEIKFLSRLNIAAILLAYMGGFSYFISRFISPQIRCYDRICVFIAFFGVLTLCIVMTMVIENSNITYKKSIIGFIGIIGFVSTIFNGATLNSITTKNTYEYAKSNEYIYDFINEIEGQVSENAMIYEMPYDKFPESGPQNKMSSYSLLIPYIYSNNNLRWSYACYKGTYGDLWHRTVPQLPMEERIMILSDVGFEGIYIDSAAYLPDEFQNLLQQLNNILGNTPIISNDKRMYFYSMKKYNESLDKNSEEVKNKLEEVKNKLKDVFYDNGPGMNPVEKNNGEQWIWNDKNSTLYVINNTKEVLKKSLTMKIGTTVDQYSDMHIECNKEGYDFKVNSQPTSCNVDFTLQPGKNEVKFSTNAPKLNIPERSIYFRITDFNFMT